jgi:predicted transcriptional regulator
MAKEQQAEMTISEIADVLRRHEGSMTAIANDLGVRVSSVSQVLSGKTGSKRIEEACRVKASALLEEKGNAA